MINTKLAKGWRLPTLLGLMILSNCTSMRTQEGIQNWEEATIEQVHAALLAGNCTCENLVQYYLDGIEAYDQSTGINAITQVNPQIIEEAQQLDRNFAVDKSLKPLHCVPLIVKDNYLTIGLQSAAGSSALKGYQSKVDAYQVRKLKEAGAIVLAKSNMAEWAFSPKVTISSLAGETRNPYNLAHTTAGSSGGTAAAIAANFGLIGLGTDTGNSIRGPSSHNALVGFRSTLGLTSRHGIFPLYLRNDVGGPMARTVADATRVLEVIAGYDPQDPLTKYSQGKVPSGYQQFLEKDGLQGARIGVLRQLTTGKIHPEVEALFQQAIKDLEAAGATVIDPIEIPSFETLAEDQWCAMFEHDLDEFLAQLDPAPPVKTLADIVKSGQFAPYIEGRLKYFLSNDQVPDVAAQTCLDPYTDAKRRAYRNAIEAVMDSLSVEAIVYPSWNYPPAKIGDFDGYKGDNSQIIAPHTGQPAFTIPMGFLENGLPTGLQFLGRMYAEPTLIELSYAYEQFTQHRLNGPKIELKASE